MSNNSFERTHGTLINSMQNLLQRISQFAGYQPPNANDSIAAIENLVQSLVQANNNEAAQLTAYRLATDERQNAFRGDDYSVSKILKYIRATVIANSGKKSRWEKRTQA